jgi:hypothetical protein
VPRARGCVVESLRSPLTAGSSRRSIRSTTARRRASLSRTVPAGRRAASSDRMSRRVTRGLRRTHAGARRGSARRCSHDACSGRTDTSGQVGDEPGREPRRAIHRAPAPALFRRGHRGGPLHPGGGTPAHGAAPAERPDPPARAARRGDPVRPLARARLADAGRRGAVGLRLRDARRRRRRDPGGSCGRGRPARPGPRRDRGDRATRPRARGGGRVRPT